LVAVLTQGLVLPLLVPRVITCRNAIPLVRISPPRSRPLPWTARSSRAYSTHPFPHRVLHFFFSFLFPLSCSTFAPFLPAVNTLTLTHSKSMPIQNESDIPHLRSWPLHPTDACWSHGECCTKLSFFWPRQRPASGPTDATSTA
jgi:hypothetical protein